MPINKRVKVYMELVRSLDNSHSEPVEFWYKPSKHLVNSAHKRFRPSSAFSSSETPLQEKLFHQSNEQQVQQQVIGNEIYQTTSNTIYNAQQIIEHTFFDAAVSATSSTATSTELNSTLFNSTECMNSDELMNLCHKTLNCFDDEKLTTDSIGDIEIMPRKKLDEGERFMSSLLTKVWPLMKECGENITKCHDFLEYLFRKATFNEER